MTADITGKSVPNTVQSKMCVLTFNLMTTPKERDNH
jgi:hypothetical protein